MPVVAHNAVTAKTHAVTGDAVGEDGFKRREILRLFEDAQPTVRTVQCVINNMALRDSLGSAHTAKL